MTPSRMWALALPAVVAVLLTVMPSGASAVAAAGQPGPVVADAVAGLASVKVGSGNGDDVGSAALAVASSEVRSGAEAGRRSVAQASPLGPGAPGLIEQAAGPDNIVARTANFAAPDGSAKDLLHASALDGTVQARWDPASGPCVDPLNFAQASVGGAAAVDTIPALPSVAGLPGAATTTPALDVERMAELKRAVEALPGPLSQLGGLLGGGSGSLLKVSNLAAAGTQVQLVEAPGQAGRAVQSISMVQLSNLQLLAGTPQELQLNVLTPPKLVATSTGDEPTSRVEYTPPVIQVLQGGRELVRLNTERPSYDVVIGLPLPDAPTPAALGRAPLVGPAFRGAVGDRVVDIGVLRLSLGQFSQQRTGATVTGVARALDITLLPTEMLPLPALPSSLVQISIGQHSVRAGAPPGGVWCPPGLPVTQDKQAKPPLAQTNGANYARELTAVGGGLLLLGSILVAALPARRRETRSAVS